MTDERADEDRARVQAANQLARDRSMIEHGRRMGGAAGAALAGAMIAVRDIYEGPKRDDGQVVVDAPSEPHDVDRDGVELTADEVGGIDAVAVPAQPRLPPITRSNTRRRARRR
ncbi:MAG: hypothetical protein ACRDZ2_05635 [Ilumatobacteraceae bacterium]